MLPVLYSKHILVIPDADFGGLNLEFLEDGRKDT
jgi:hypothetical protein